MRGGHAQPSRSAWYDRAAVVQGKGYDSGAIAPAVNTTRISYTIASNTKAYIEWLYLFLLRNTVAAPVGISNIQVTHTPSGGSTFELANVFSVNNTANTFDRFQSAPNFIALPGDSLLVNTQDLSTGGTNTFRAFLKATEFSS